MRLGRQLPDGRTRRLAFRVFPDFTFGVECWRWECSLCWPPARGARYGPDAYRRVLHTSMPSHFDHRRSHHDWVRGQLRG